MLSLIRLPIVVAGRFRVLAPPGIRVIDGDATAKKPWNTGDRRLESQFRSAKRRFLDPETTSYRLRL